MILSRVLLSMSIVASGLLASATTPPTAKPEAPAASAAAPAPAASPAPSTPGSPAATATAKPAAAAAKSPAPVSGVVTKPDGKPIAGATVRIIAAKEDSGRMRFRSRSAAAPTVLKTNDDGTFAAPKLEGTKFTVRVEAPGLAPFRADDIPAGATLRVGLKPGTPISGRVLDQDSKAPVPGAVVVAFDSGAEGFGEDAALRTVTGEDGKFTIANLPSVDAVIEAYSPRHARGRLDRSGVAAAGDRVIWLRPGGRIAGTVTGTDGKPIAGIQASLRPAESGLLSRAAFEAPGSVRTDASGAFAFDGVAAGKRWQVVAQGDGFGEGETAPVAVERGSNISDLAIKLEASSSIAFKVVDREGKPVTDVQIAVEPAEKQGGPGARGARFGMDTVDEERIQIGADGRIVARGFDPGLFNVTVMPEAGADIEKEGQRLRPGETLDLGTLRLADGKTISGRITDKTGAPVVKAEVSAFWLAGGKPKFRSVKSKADGRYMLGGLSDQPLRSFSVRAKGFAQAEKPTASPGDTNLDFVLEKTASIVGKVLNPQGQALPAFQVKAHPEAQANSGGRFNMRRMEVEPEKPFTDPSGIFKLEDVAPGTVTVEVKAPGWAATRKTGVTIAAEQIIDVGTIVLEKGRTLRGRVLDLKNDTPLAGAVVAANPSQGMAMMRFGGITEDAGSAVTGTDGSFALEGLEGRTYVVSVGHPDFATNDSTVEVPAEEDPAEVTVRLGRGGTLSGVVRDAAKQPVAGANIIALQGNMGGEPSSGVSGADGRYTIEKLAPGSYNVTRIPDSNRIIIGFGMKQAAIREGETTTIDFDENAKHNITGRVLKGDKVVPNAGLVFFAGDGSGMGASAKSVEADAEGKYQVGLDAPGSYSVIFRGSGLFSGGAPVKITVPDAPTANIDIVLRTLAISGSVRDPEGKPVPGAIVSAAAEGAATAHRRGGGIAESDSEGRFVIEGVEAGTYKVNASARGFAAKEVSPIQVTEQSAAPDVDIRLEVGRTIRGRVVDPRGNGVAEAWVFAAAAGSTQSNGMQASTDVNGSFAISVANEGTWDLAAIGAGRAPGRANGVVPSDDADAPIVTIALGTGGKLRVAVAGADGKPAANVGVTVTATTPYLGSEYLNVFNRPTPTGTDGASLVAGLSPGSYEVVAQSGGKSARGEVVVPEGGEAALSLVLP